jgi:hypothetical protein
LNKQLVFSLIISITVACIIATYAAVTLTVAPQQTELPSTAFTYTISASSNCLRFLNNSVPVMYVPFTVAAGQTGKLIINCTEIPGVSNGWTDVYIYKGYWDGGADHICRAGDIYSILKDIEPTDFAIKIGQSYVGNFSEETQQSYTLFFLVPPGGPSAFTVSYKPA